MIVNSVVFPDLNADILTVFQVHIMESGGGNVEIRTGRIQHSIFLYCLGSRFDIIVRGTNCSSGGGWHHTLPHICLYRQVIGRGIASAKENFG